MYFLELSKKYKQCRINGEARPMPLPPTLPLMRPAGGKGWIKNKGKFSGRRRTKTDLADNETSAYDQGYSSWITSGCYLFCFLWTVSNTSLLYRDTFQKYTILSAKANSAVFIGWDSWDKRIDKRRVTLLNVF